MIRVDRNTKSNAQSVPYYYLNNGDIRPASAVKVIKASTGGIYNTSDVVWTAMESRMSVSVKREKEVAPSYCEEHLCRWRKRDWKKRRFCGQIV